MDTTASRRDFLRIAGAGMTAMGVAANRIGAAEEAKKRDFNISLAAWSLHRGIGDGENKIPMLDMPKIARQEFDIGAIELVNQMLASSEKAYMDQLAKNAADNDVNILLIMVDGEGTIGSKREESRDRAVERHMRWVDIAADLGCNSIRMNWQGAHRDVMNVPEELTAFIERSKDPLRELCDYGDKKSINVLIENHGGPSSHPEAMVRLMKAVDHKRFGTLPDFGNFPPAVDRYEAVDTLMKYAKAVSAKCYDFDPETGEESLLDFERLIKIVVDEHGYHGYIGIEYEGNRLSEFDGVKACKKLLEKLRG